MTIDPRRLRPHDTHSQLASLEARIRGQERRRQGVPVFVQAELPDHPGPYVWVRINPDGTSNVFAHDGEA